MSIWHTLRSKRFTGDGSGNVSVIFGLAFLPLVSLTGAAVDYSRASNLHTFMQQATDTAALTAASSPSTASQALEQARSTILKKYGTNIGSKVDIQGRWINATDYKVSTNGAMGTSFMQALPGMPDTLPVTVNAVVRIAKTTVTTDAPVVAQLDPEAGDYNRISVYCFDHLRTSASDAGRTQMTAMSDNGGTVYKPSMPACKEGETLSYRLHNVRNARTNPALWDSTTAEQYDYYSDTTMVGLVQQYNFADNVQILETVVCNTLDECKPQTAGGILPSGKNRTPQVATTACDPGKFMYYGWEDRPPGKGTTDRDYDDIRVIVSCPKVTVSMAKQAYLIE